MPGVDVRFPCVPASAVSEPGEFIKRADAVRTAFAIAPPGGTVVLAPACSSFDMFRDYAERGEVFAEEVRKLAGDRRATREQ